MGCIYPINPAVSTEGLNKKLLTQLFRSHTHFIYTKIVRGRRQKLKVSESSTQQPFFSCLVWVLILRNLREHVCFVLKRAI